MTVSLHLLNAFTRQVFAKASERQNVPKVQLLTIWFGANDAVLTGEQQHVPLEQYKANLSKLIHMVRDPSSEYYSPETRIILFTPPPVLTHVLPWRARSLPAVRVR